MQYPILEQSCYEQAKLVIKNTFLEFECLDNEHLKMRRKSDPAGACVEGCEHMPQCGKSACEWEEVTTPSTCVSVNGDEDDERASALSTACSIDDADDSSREGKFSFSGEVVSELFSMSQAPVQHVGVQSAWVQSCDARPLLSTSPVLPALAAAPVSGLNGGCSMMQNDTSDCAKTTLMIRNLPSCLTQTGFVQHFIDAGYRGLFDFVYMPMNFRAQGNFGYAFVNFISHDIAAHVVMEMLSLEHDDASSSERWTSAWSSSQGFSENIDRYRNSPLMHERVPYDCKPALYDCNGNRMSFPQPTKTISKPRIRWPSKEKRTCCTDECCTDDCSCCTDE